MYSVYLGDFLLMCRLLRGDLGHVLATRDLLQRWDLPALAYGEGQYRSLRPRR